MLLHEVTGSVASCAVELHILGSVYPGLKISSFQKIFVLGSVSRIIPHYIISNTMSFHWMKAVVYIGAYLIDLIVA